MALVAAFTLASPAPAHAAAIVTSPPICFQESDGDIIDEARATIMSGDGFVKMTLQRFSSGVWINRKTVRDEANGSSEVSVDLFFNGVLGQKYRTVTIFKDRRDGDTERYFSGCQRGFGRGVVWDFVPDCVQEDDGDITDVAAMWAGTTGRLRMKLQRFSTGNWITRAQDFDDNPFDDPAGLNRYTVDIFFNGVIGQKYRTKTVARNTANGDVERVFSRCD